MSWRALFLVGAAVVGVFNLQGWQVPLFMFAYICLARLDEWLGRRAKERVIADELDGWEPDKEDPDSEIKGNLSRLKLSKRDQVIVTRIAQLLRRI